MNFLLHFNDYFSTIIDIGNTLRLNFDKDIIFDEINTFNQTLNSLTAGDKELGSVEIIKNILKSKNFPNILKIFEAVMSMPVANDFVERVFSDLFNIWTDQRNRLSIASIKAEICILNNFNQNCLDFKNFIKSNQKCIKAVKSGEKYKHLMK